MGSPVPWVVIGVVLLLVVVSRVPSDRPNATRPSDAETWTPPAGYKLIGNGVAGRWPDIVRCEYESADACWELELIAKYGCESLYVEVTILDASGAVIDWSNDTARGVGAGQLARVTIESFESAAQTARIERVNCR